MRILKNWLEHKILRKVPEITIYFWIIKLLTTAMGETTSDYLVHKFNPIIVVVFSGLVLIITLILQFLVKQYTAWIYWLVVVMVAIFGTMLADVLHIGFGIPYIISAIFFTTALTVIFIFWKISEKTLSIHSINTHNREIFYWSTVMATFALGTAIGDMTAITFHLGYLSSGILFIILFTIPGIACWKFGLNKIFAFWFAYIATRPLGASFADWVGKSQDLGGIGVGTGTVSIILTILIMCFTTYLTITRKDIKISKN